MSTETDTGHIWLLSLLDGIHKDCRKLFSLLDERCAILLVHKDLVSQFRQVGYHMNRCWPFIHVAYCHCILCYTSFMCHQSEQKLFEKNSQLQIVLDKIKMSMNSHEFEKLIRELCVFEEDSINEQSASRKIVLLKQYYV